MQQPNFNENEIPYEALSYIGLSKEMISDLPDSEKNRLLSGLPTSPLMLRLYFDGNTIKETRASIYLKRVQEKNSLGEDVSRVAHVSVAQRSALDLSEYPESLRPQLREGQLIFAKNPLCAVANGPGFYQVDKVLNCVIFMPSESIRDNLLTIVGKEYLSNGEISTLVSGKLVTRYDANKNATTFGISLSEDSGIKVVNGDKQAWRQAVKEENWNRHFGLEGCWSRMEDGCLCYTPSEQYDDEMLEEWHEHNNNSLNR